MIVHKLIEAMVSDGAAQTDIQAVSNAHKFEIRSGEFWSSEVGEYAQLLVNCGLIRLPFSSCYFEIPAHLVVRGMAGQTLCIIANDRGDKIDVSGVLHWGEFGFDKEGIATGSILYLDDNPGVSTEQKNPMGGVAVCSFLAAILAFLDLKETQLSDVPVKEHVNRHRIARGKQPFYPHKVLTITKAARDALMSSEHHTSLIKRRAHWRRGHLRHLPDKIVPVAPALVRGEGFVSKDYRL